MYKFQSSTCKTVGEKLRTKLCPRTDINGDFSIPPSTSLCGINTTFKESSLCSESSQNISFNSLPNDKILDWSKLKAFADDTINVTQKFKFVLGRVENIVGKGENAAHCHFLLFPQCFQKTTFSGSLKVGIVW